MKKPAIVTFGDVVRNVDETVRDPQNSGLERYVGLEHIDPGSLHIQRWGLISEGTSFTRRFRKGQVLFGKRRAYQRKVAVAEFDGLCSSDILVFQPKDDRLLPELLPFICQSDGFFEHALDTSAGSLSPRTKFKELARYKFPLPPLDEQRRIAEILWAADDLFTMWKLTDLKIQLSIKSLISNFLNQKWPLCELAKVGEIVTGATPPTKNSEYYQGGDILFIGPSDFNGNKYIKNAAKKITKRGLDVVRSIPKNAVMVTCIGLIGKVALSDSLCATNQQINSIICNETCDPLFLYFVLSTLTDELNKNASCSVVPILNKSNMATIKIPLPPRKDQIKFLEKIHYFEGTKQNIQNHICILSRLRDSLVNNWF
ncbi:MAG: hypothetical protein GYA48_17730 [Chloroflexi bacterium]|nr:hypothetical protein [Chloroflexota bacterium]